MVKKKLFKTNWKKEAKAKKKKYNEKLLPKISLILNSQNLPQMFSETDYIEKKKK